MKLRKITISTPQNIGTPISFSQNPLLTPQSPGLSLIDIETNKPKLYQEYVDKADGTAIVTYNPRSQKCDSNGFVFHEISMATRRGDEVRFIDKDHFINYVIKDGVSYWAGSLRGMDKARAANEGEEFVGWKRTKQYRLTMDEIKSELKGKLFTHSVKNW
jgi:hypothetical protein